MLFQYILFQRLVKGKHAFYHGYANLLDGIPRKGEQNNSDRVHYHGKRHQCRYRNEFRRKEYRKSHVFIRFEFLFYEFRYGIGLRRREDFLELDHRREIEYREGQWQGYEHVLYDGGES